MRDGGSSDGNLYYDDNGAKATKGCFMVLWKIKHGNNDALFSVTFKPTL
jgi:hypothetical protein